MSQALRVGLRLRSQVCSTEVIVVRVADASLTVTCGGQPMIALGETADPALILDGQLAGGSELGKRYNCVDGSGSIEGLVTKAGEGSLAVDGIRLVRAAAKALPTSD